MARGVAQRRGPGRPVVAVQGQEHLVVVLDQPVPQLLPVVGQVRGAGVVGVGDLVRGDDHRQRRVVGDDLVGPGESGRREPPVQAEQQPVATAAAEEVEGVVAVGARAAEARRLRRARLGERARIRRGAALVVPGHVVVAGDDAVGGLLAVQHLEHRAGRGELPRLPVLRQVAEVRHEDDVRVLVPAEDVAERGLHRRRVDPVLVEHVLRVRHHDEREHRVLRVRIPAGARVAGVDGGEVVDARPAVLGIGGGTRCAVSTRRGSGSTRRRPEHRGAGSQRGRPRTRATRRCAGTRGGRSRQDRRSRSRRCEGTGSEGLHARGS